MRPIPRKSPPNKPPALQLRPTGPVRSRCLYSKVSIFPCSTLTDSWPIQRPHCRCQTVPVQFSDVFRDILFVHLLRIGPRGTSRGVCEIESRRRTRHFCFFAFEFSTCFAKVKDSHSTSSTYARVSSETYPIFPQSEHYRLE
jgi:hypothetical protein